MTSEDCAEVFQQLELMLSELQMDWVINEVKEVLEAGKLIDSPVLNSTKKLSREFRTTRVYTPQEALLILIDSIESSIVHTAFMEEEVTSFFREEGRVSGIAPEIRFLAEEDSQPTIFSYDSARDRAERAQQLKRLLEQLRLEV